MMNHYQRKILAEAAKYGGTNISKIDQITRMIGEEPVLTGGEAAPTLFGWGKHQFEAKFRELLTRMGFERGIIHMKTEGQEMKLYFANAAKARDFTIAFNGLARRKSMGSVASVATQFNKIKSPTGTNAIVSLDLTMVRGESLDLDGTDLYEWFVGEGEQIEEAVDSIKLVKEMGSQTLYRYGSEYYIVSSSSMGGETAIFREDSSGKPKSYESLWSERKMVDHDYAIKDFVKHKFKKDAVVESADPLTEGGVKTAIEDFMYSLPKEAITELKTVMKIKSLQKRFAMINKTLTKHGVAINQMKLLGSYAADVINAYFNTFHGESFGVNEQLSNYLAFHAKTGQQITVQASSTKEAETKGVEALKASNKKSVHVRYIGPVKEEVEVAEAELTEGPYTVIPYPMIIKGLRDAASPFTIQFVNYKGEVLYKHPKEINSIQALPAHMDGIFKDMKGKNTVFGWHRVNILDKDGKVVNSIAAYDVPRKRVKAESVEVSEGVRMGGYSHWTDHTKVIRTSSWRHKETGRSVSSGGAVPWRTPAEKSEWEEIAYFVFYDTVNGTTFGGRYDTEQKAKAALDKAKRDHQKEVAKYVTAPQVRKRIQELENEIVGIGNRPSMAGGAVRMKRAEDEIKRLKQQLRSLGVKAESVEVVAEPVTESRTHKDEFRWGAWLKPYQYLLEDSTEKVESFDPLTEAKTVEFSIMSKDYDGMEAAYQALPKRLANMMSGSGFNMGSKMRDHGFECKNESDMQAIVAIYKKTLGGSKVTVKKHTTESVEVTEKVEVTESIDVQTAKRRFGNFQYKKSSKTVSGDNTEFVLHGVKENELRSIFGAPKSSGGMKQWSFEHDRPLDHQFTIEFDGSDAYINSSRKGNPTVRDHIKGVFGMMGLRVTTESVEEDTDPLTESDKYATFFKGEVAPMKLNKGKKYKLADILVTVKSGGELYRSGDYSHYGVSYDVEFPHPRNARSIIKGYLSMAPNGGFRLNVGAITIIRAESGGFGQAQKTSEYDWFLNHGIGIGRIGEEADALTEAKEYILWAIPSGETDELHSQPIYTQGKSPQDVERVKKLAAAKGFHSFRVQVLDLSQPFDAGAAFRKAINPPSKWKRGGVKKESVEVNEYYRRSGFRSSSYSGDPRWITAKYAGVDAKGRAFKKGEEVLYYPNGKKIYSGPEAEKMWREFLSAKGDEMGMPYAS